MPNTIVGAVRAPGGGGINFLFPWSFGPICHLVFCNASNSLIMNVQSAADVCIPARSCDMRHASLAETSEGRAWSKASHRSFSPHSRTFWEVSHEAIEDVLALELP